jgi:uncharacterized iron-regulated membrane protein
MARVFGTPYQVLVAFFGVVTAVLAVTGTLIWFHKHEAQRRRHAAAKERNGGCGERPIPR